MLAVIVVVPAETPVATPVGLMVATPGTLEVQVAGIGDVLCAWRDGCSRDRRLPVAVNCAVWPTETDCDVGETEIETANGLVQPAIGSAIAMRRSSRGERTRSCMVDLRSLQTALTLIESSSWQTLAGLYAFDYRASIQCTAVTRRCYFLLGIKTVNKRHSASASTFCGRFEHRLGHVCAPQCPASPRCRPCRARLDHRPPVLSSSR